MGVPTIFCPPNLHDARFYGLLDFIKHAFTLQEALNLQPTDLEAIIGEDKLNFDSYREVFKKNIESILTGDNQQVTHSPETVGRLFSTKELIDQIAIREESIKHLEWEKTSHSHWLKTTHQMERDALLSERDALLSERDALASSNSDRLTKLLRAIGKFIKK